jgi:hypothetical protein
VILPFSWVTTITRSRCEKQIKQAKYSNASTSCPDKLNYKMQAPAPATPLVLVLACLCLELHVCSSCSQSTDMNPKLDARDWIFCGLAGGKLFERCSKGLGVWLLTAQPGFAMMLLCQHAAEHTSAQSL